MWAFPCAPDNQDQTNQRETRRTEKIMAPLNSNRSIPPSAHRLPASVDYIAVGIGLVLAVLVRFGVLHQLSF